MRKEGKQIHNNPDTLYSMPDTLYSRDLEQDLLGCLMQDHNNNALLSVVDILRVEHFYYSKHQDVFRAMIKIAFGSNNNIDVMSVAQQVMDDNVLWKNEANAFIISLHRAAISSYNTIQYAKQIVQKYKLRELYKTTICNLIKFTESGDDTDIYPEIEKNIMDTLTKINATSKKSEIIKDIYPLVLTEIQEYTNRSSKKVLPSGIDDVDELLGGWRSGLIIMAGMESIGKTTMALNFTYKLLKQGINGLFFSFETGAEFLVTRLACMESRINIADFIGRKLTNGQYDGLLKATKRVCDDYGLVVNDNSTCTVMDIITKAKLEKVKNNIKFIIVDHLQRITPIENIGLKFRTQQVTQDVMLLKALSVELEIPIFVISTLNNDGGLRESRMINYEADVIMFLSRVKNSDGTLSDEMELEIKKHRFGDRGKIELLYYSNGNIYENYYTAERG